MLFRTHLLLGVIVFLLLHNFFSGGSPGVFLFLVLLGSILPDIDEAHSKINQWSGIAGRMVSFFARHRGFFHSLILALLLLLIITYFWSSYYAWGLFLGYLAHLIGDALTPLGVQWLYPFSQHTLRGPVKTGGLVEIVLFALLILFVVWRLI